MAHGVLGRMRSGKLRGAGARNNKMDSLYFRSVCQRCYANNVLAADSKSKHILFQSQSRLLIYADSRKGSAHQYGYAMADGCGILIPLTEFTLCTDLMEIMMFKIDKT